MERPTGPAAPAADPAADRPVTGPTGTGPAVTRPTGTGPTVTVTADTPERMRELGRRTAALLRAGDLVLLSGHLGAGKTTFTRGLGEGLGVRGAVTSPTFVIARVHPSLRQGPPLVHVDAYRLGGGLEEMEDLDLDVSLPESVVVVEWGEGKVEELSEARLQIVVERQLGGADGDGDAGAGEDGDDPRRVTFTGIGPRWADARLEDLAPEGV
ncbi:tRNA (adenosine(37)-N6)-threonylcarbamoyltransferase complex ATPase subunit type 1 TsaE [Streptomyces sp. NPDC059506]|uniref:tRNA (adenosine(37)-N6)-threonylcarbamoyltransferase complex ATPase subunit type 1 TsaE n=1 Tax=Streptomyces sp. NPDC059506 TaxID=3347751 RepID=UPI0036C69D46